MIQNETVIIWAFLTGLVIGLLPTVLWLLLRKSPELDGF